MYKSTLRTKLYPFLLGLGIIAVDQGIKFYIVRRWPLQAGAESHGRMVKNVFDNDFLWIYHVRNRAVAFSLGQELPEHLKPLLFVALPLMVLVLLMIYYFRSDEFNLPQRWFFAGIIGGGLGNMLDRTFRPTGVVDFISVKFYGFLGLERWPTFNIADAVVVICCSFLFLSILLPSRKEVRRTA